MKMPFGMYRGVPLSELPEDYFEWLLSNIDLREPLKSAVLAESQRRNGRPQSTPHHRPAIPVLLEIIAAGGRSLARQYHPDLGGDPEKMKSINFGADFLEERIRAEAGG